MRKKLERFYVTCQFDMFTQILGTFKAIHCQGNVYLEVEDGDGDGDGNWKESKKTEKPKTLLVFIFSTINTTNKMNSTQTDNTD